MENPKSSPENSFSPLPRRSGKGEPRVAQAEVEEKTPGRPTDGMTPAEQIKEYERLLSAQSRLGGLQVGSKHYLLNRKWFVQWLQWVGHPSAQARGEGRLVRTQSATQGEDLSEPTLRRGQSMPEVPNPTLVRMRSWTKDQPGPIDNELLLEEGSHDTLRRGVFENLDFVIVPADVWDLLYTCYGGGPAIARHAIRMQGGEVQIEIHLLKVRGCKVLDHENVVSGEISRTATVADLKSCLCRGLGIEPAKARILNLAFDDEENEAIEDCRIEEDQLLLIDELTPAGTWGYDLDDEDWSAPTAPTPQSAEKGTPETAKSFCPKTDEEGASVRTGGLKNLGNTCFMNSSLQCVANIPQMREYFITGKFKEALKIYGRATEKTQGKLAESFAKLLQSLWDEADGVKPWDFKEIVGKSAERFTGNRQHDSMEFIEFLIDGLKEDCNKVKGQKIYVERADAGGRDDVEVALDTSSKFLLRNDSDIDDLFVGFFKSTLTCPDESCCKESVAFDPFLSLKLPIISPEKSHSRSFRVDVIPLASSGRSIQRCYVSVAKFGSIDVLVNAVAAEAGIQPENCVLAEIFRGKVYKFFEESDRLEDISSDDILVLYEMDDAPSFKKPASKRWGVGGDVKKGDLVFVKETFESDSMGDTKLPEGVHGLVELVDGDGDARIRFDGIDRIQWVFARNLHRLTVDRATHSEKQKRDPSDDEVYTLDGLINTCAFEEFEGEFWDLQRLLDYWKYAMIDVTEDVEDEASPPQCGVIVSFRKAASKASEKPEAFGIPIVFCIQRDTEVNNLIKVVRRELKTRKMPIKKDKWTFYRTREGTLYNTEVLLTEATDETEETIRFGERQYLVLEWEGDDTPEAPNIEDVKVEEEEDEVTLDMCFRWMTDREQLAGEDAVYCSCCGDFRQSFKKVDIWSLPPVLVIQLKRFEFTGMDRRRINTKVQFPLEGLDLREFCLSCKPSFPKEHCLRFGQRVEIHGLTSSLGQRMNGSAGKIEYVDSSTGSPRWCVRLDEAPEILTSITPGNLKLIDLKESPESVLPVFDLAAISKHIGGASFGHYVAYARSSCNGLWYLFDDDDVTEVSPQVVEEEQEGAYVLFYLRRDCIPHSWNT